MFLAVEGAREDAGQKGGGYDVGGRSRSSGLSNLICDTFGSIFDRHIFRSFQNEKQTMIIKIFAPDYNQHKMSIRPLRTNLEQTSFTSSMRQIFSTMTGLDYNLNSKQNTNEQISDGQSQKRPQTAKQTDKQTALQTDDQALETS